MPHAVKHVNAEVTCPFKRQPLATIPPPCVPDGLPPALRDRSTWIESLEPWRREKVRPDLHALGTWHKTASSASRHRPDNEFSLRHLAGEHYLPPDDSDSRSFVTGSQATYSDELLSATGSPYVAPQTAAVIAGWTKSMRQPNRRPSELADRSTRRLIGDSAIGARLRSAMARRRMSDCGSQSPTHRQIVTRRDSLAASVGELRSYIAEDLATPWNMDVALSSCDSGRDADDEAGNYFSSDSDSSGVASDVSSSSTDPYVSSSESLPVTGDQECPEFTECATDTDNNAISQNVAVCMAPDSPCIQSKALSAHPTQQSPSKSQATAVAAVTPSAQGNVPASIHAVTSSDHQQLLCFLADWAADQVWKVVTTGSSIAAMYRGFHLSENPNLPSVPPPYLSDAIKGCLLATSLQPSAVFLALWYIVKLPVYIGEAAYEPETSAYHFRRVLLGEGVVPFGSLEKQNLELYSPFKLFVNGALLASKTLDDHTYSNRCWHEVSRIQIRDINSLELYSLDLLGYDLTVSHEAWMHWLSSLRAHHRSSAPYPTPIGPVRDTPHSVILRLLDRLIDASASNYTCGVAKAPVFIATDDTPKPKILLTEDSDDWDPDEHGPMKDEHRRRKAIPGHKHVLDQLPPPAAWSPAADPPLDPNRSRPIYLAVQKSPDQPARQCALQLMSEFPCGHLPPHHPQSIVAPGAPRIVPAHHPTMMASQLPPIFAHALPTALLHPVPYYIPYHYEVPVGAFYN